MDKKDILARIGVVVAIVIAIIGIVTPSVQNVAEQAAQNAQTTAGNILDTNYFDFFQATTGYQLGNARAGTINTGGGVVSCGTTVVNALVSGSLPAACNVLSSSASSTVIAIGPFIASSTLTQLIVSGFNGATTTDLLVATSTTPAPATGTATSTIAENVMGLAGVGANTQFYSVMGTKIGSSKGYANAAGNTYITTTGVGVGVGDYLLVFSTSTAAGSGGTAAAQVSVPTSITVKYEYQN